MTNRYLDAWYDQLEELREMPPSLARRAAPEPVAPTRPTDHLCRHERFLRLGEHRQCTACAKRFFDLIDLPETSQEIRREWRVRFLYRETVVTWPLFSPGGATRIEAADTVRQQWAQDVVQVLEVF